MSFAAHIPTSNEEESQRMAEEQEEISVAAVVLEEIRDFAEENANDEYGGVDMSAEPAPSDEELEMQRIAIARNYLAMVGPARLADTEYANILEALNEYICENCPHRIVTDDAEDPSTQTMVSIDYCEICFLSARDILSMLPPPPTALQAEDEI